MREIADPQCSRLEARPENSRHRLHLSQGEIDSAGSVKTERTPRADIRGHLCTDAERH